MMGYPTPQESAAYRELERQERARRVQAVSDFMFAVFMRSAVVYSLVLVYLALVA